MYLTKSEGLEELSKSQKKMPIPTPTMLQASIEEVKEIHTKEMRQLGGAMDKNFRLQEEKADARYAELLGHMADWYGGLKPVSMSTYRLALVIP